MQDTFSTDATVLAGRSAFDQLMQESNKLIVAKFGAPHCSSCETLKPVLHQIAAEYADSLHLVDLDMTEDPDLAVELGVRSVPTVVLLKGQTVLETIAGLKPKKTYLETIQKVL
jgi:thioredoxin-like negative regulator of GroEL